MQMFVTWIMAQTAALHPGFGLSWSEGVWTCICIIIQKHKRLPLVVKMSFFYSGGRENGFLGETIHALQSGSCYCICRRMCKKKCGLQLSSDSKWYTWTASVSVCASNLLWHVVMVILWCVRCKISEECRYWSCPGSPGNTNALDNLTYTAQTQTSKSS